MTIYKRFNSLGNLANLFSRKECDIQRTDRNVENDNPDETVSKGFSRRQFMKLPVAAGTGYVVARQGLDSVAYAEPTGPASPPTTPFVDELFIPPVLEPTTLTPAPDKCPVTGEKSRDCHQGWESYPPEKHYELVAQEVDWQFHSELPPARVWGFNGNFNGPTIKARYGEPIIVRIRNELPTDHQGFGIPEISTHLHNAHTPWESDGHANQYYGSGLFKDHHYPNTYAGGDSREALGTLFYHDHRHGFTGPNVYRGLLGNYRLYDEVDSDNERDTNPQALRLPSGEYDVPLVFSDKILQADGQLYFDELSHDGFIGDKFTVNGKVQPYFKVARRKYRFRLVNGSASRFYQFFLAKGDLQYQSRGESEPITLIATDGNLLSAPIQLESTRIAVAERVDIVIDFSRYNIGDRVYLVNRLQQDSEKRARDTIRDWDESDWILEFRIDRDEEDPSQVPAQLRELPPVNLDEVVRERNFIFERSNGAWAINDQFFDPQTPMAVVERGTAEIWNLRNNSGGWSHPVHIHLEEFQLLAFNGKPPTNPHHAGRKDVIELGPNDEARVFMRFRTWLGRYMAHCHNTPHEDHSMMFRWDVVDSGSGQSTEEGSTASVAIDSADCEERIGGIRLEVRGTASGDGTSVTIEDADTGELFGSTTVETDGTWRFRLEDDPNFLSCPSRVRALFGGSEDTASVGSE